MSGKEFQFHSDSNPKLRIILIYHDVSHKNASGTFGISYSSWKKKVIKETFSGVHEVLK